MTDERSGHRIKWIAFATAWLIGSVPFLPTVAGTGRMDVVDHADTAQTNCDRLVQFGPEQVISGAAWDTRSIFAADLDGDGDADVILASSDLCDGYRHICWANRIVWYENLDGDGNFGPMRIISRSINLAQSVFATDLDGDGDADVISASWHDDKIAWYENTNGAGAFGPQQLISVVADGATSVFAADLDNDGDADILSSSELDDKIAWYENTDGAGTFGPQQVISVVADGAMSVFASDLDGDGDVDVISASELDNKIAWYENTDGAGSFSRQRIISNLAERAKQAIVADVDGDGDPDVISASAADNKIAWYENTDGFGRFSRQRVISVMATGARAVFAGDLDGDRDADILSASFEDDLVAWYENSDGDGRFAPLRVISSEADGVVSVIAADLDGDWDLDVLSASLKDNKVVWYENRGDRAASNSCGLTGGIR